ncbi:uncharacterized protein LOC112680837 [Sipha flava]|uniref:Uncharacterized protein LOC112680837 n=1 Tax=Sipha flava TaxID=143950 RepID=A0A8B8F902_9HEMI|nr:uncharacterized protein LOC112680837 [Sipha flava]
MAVKRFESLERKLSADQTLRHLYREFMSEYLALGHMSIAKSPGQYFIPHHAVYRPDDGDSKIRVVFDASAHGPRGPSLNQCLHPGPKLQQDIIDVLTRFRIHKFAFTADICKMYRQILVLPEYRNLQHILWRSSPEDEQIEYELNTVTYGINCAPFLALRVLKYIADTDCVDSDAIRQALLLQTYVDDFCVGADSVTELIRIKNELIYILDRAGMQLKKWLSNSDELINTVPGEDRLTTPMPFHTLEGECTKVLGLSWEPVGDFFSCALRTDSSSTYTKRGVLSLIARIFDPLGLFAPTVFLAKHIMQRLWQSKLSWDAPLPIDVHIEWSSFVSDLPALLSLQVPRHMGTVGGSPCLLLGFCDASMRGYAAVLYLRVLDAPRESCIFLLGTKTKLAPLKEVTIPRLELNAALLLAKWMARIKTVLSSQLSIVDTYAWTDSSIVLLWLNIPHEKFKIYVSNRVHQIHTLLPGCQWYHVRSEMNPADCASRGIKPTELANSSLYWNGPKFIRDEKTSWNNEIPIVPYDKLPEVRPTSLAVQLNDSPVEWFNTFSSYDKLVRIVAQIFRFINRCRYKSAHIAVTPLSCAELDAANVALVIASQKCHFSVLIHELSRGQPLSSRPIAKLRPFIDKDRIIRVGGRLRYSSLSYESKHPILLGKRSHLALLLVRRWHKITCHSGPRLLTALISRQYWIVSIRSIIHEVVSNCLVCNRLDGRPIPPLMADLPAARVQECKSFQNVGIDYAGPFQMRETRLRKPRQYKAYVAVFICLAVKAVHLELVSDFTTDAFLAALDRFVARRGLPVEIFSDCGTNFIGANKQLQDLICSPTGKTILQNSRSAFKWNFNPPGAPHFGGLWETAVRSAKRLMVRIIGAHILSYEELTTVFTRIEAVLNSRPITPLSTDPHDFEALTPGHFLIGQPLLAVPPKTPFNAKMNIINRWKLLDQCHQAFWRRWSSEYLTTLQARSKWTSSVPTLRIDDMVIVVDNSSSPLQWRLGRVTALMPGADGVVRVARVLTKHGEVIRPVVKLVILPSQ